MTVTVALDSWVTAHEPSLVDVRRALHERPELGRHEHETTALLIAQLTAAGLAPKPLAGGTGVVCDIGSGESFVVLRADIDALPLQDEKAAPYRSKVDGVCHACGHDVHTAVVLGAGLFLAGQQLPGRVRLVFQHAEEQMPGGAIDVIEQGLLDGASAIFGLHCDPSLAVGHVGLKSGPITAAADAVEVRISGPGGHTSRPHNTVDVVHVLSTVATGLPDALSRLVDPRAGVCMVWGHVAAGTVHNAIPREGVLAGTLRMLDKTIWEQAPELVARLVQQFVAPYGAVATVTYERGVPPVVNDAAATALLTAAVVSSLGPAAAVPTQQSLGGEDFAWYLEQVPGAMARLGVRGPAVEQVLDLHQPTFDVDEACIGVGVRVLVTAALAALSAGS
ncbi:MAG: amidohydrolase [Frankiales bacterium]|nr:amidohydrolase [Frankiales bacterium]